MNRNDLHDVIIIGAGAAGLSAGLVLARARANVLVIDSGAQRNAPATHIHGFITRDGIPPAEFLATGGDELAHYGASLLRAGVEASIAKATARSSSRRTRATRKHVRS
ncbi:FAD-dependent oxidoreductase [Microbacterium aurantiacum]|uniref:FAD-dependent oxidoreductase n=1 Tax=Microbacterium aurantiacum TaxID=162393 RepID=UPI001CA5B8AC|nr:FAD-dependent oxidoreductase [Microbacterium aurantiacum]